GRAARDDLARAPRGRRARPGGRPAGGEAADGLRRVPARPEVIAPARRAAYEVIRRVFEEGAYADRALAAAVRGLDQRDRARAQGGEPTEIPGGYRVARADPADIAAGRVWPQSRGSQLAALVVDSNDGERVLDACAAPGGKATMLRGAVTAVEVHAGRARELE